MMMGVWFFTLAAASAIAGQLAKFAAIPPQGNHNMLLSASHYGHAFGNYGVVAIAAGLLMLLLCPSLTRRMQLK